MKFKAKIAAAASTVGAALTLLVQSVHAQVLSATDANTIVDTVQDNANTFLTTTLPLVLIGLVILAYVFKMYGRVRRGR